MKTTVTQATENRIKAMLKQNRYCRYDRFQKYGKILDMILNNLKSRESYLGASIKECEKDGIVISNSTQIIFPNLNEIHGLSSVFSDYINYTGTHGLNCLTIKDFNGLVKAYQKRYDDNDEYYMYD